MLCATNLIGGASDKIHLPSIIQIEPIPLFDGGLAVISCRRTMEKIMKKSLVAALLVIAMLVSAIPVNAGPPPPPSPFMTAYFALEQQIADAIVHGQITRAEGDLFDLLMDNAYVWYIYIQTTKATAMLKQISETLAKMKAVGTGGADAAGARLTLLMAFQFTLECKPRYFGGFTIFECGTVTPSPTYVCYWGWCREYNPYRYD